VHVEVPPESAPLFRELLKKLGVVSKYQADRTQQAVGGSAEKSLELKQRTDDVRFELNLYNSANIKPRETLHFKLGVADVAETYRTIREAVAKMKGQIRKSDLNEKDPMNITAELVFNVAAPDRAAIDKLVAASGLIVSKHTVQAAINETATERSVGYELALRNIAAIPPRDIFTIAVAAQDVAGSYRKLHDAVSQMKGRIHKGQLNEVDKFNVSAVLDFDLASADKAALDKLISEIGVAISRNNEQFPAKDESTDQKVGYRLTLKNASGMTPREKAMIAMRVEDVEGRASQLKELVLASKGRVMFSKTESTKDGEMKMVLIFELPHASLDTIVRQIKDGKKPLVYDKELNPQVPDNDLATARITLTLMPQQAIMPTEEDGLSSMLRKGLSNAVYFLMWGMVVIISGLAIIVPWLIPIWIVVWLVRRNRAVKVVEAPKVE
jgi:predicted thioesterase